MTEIDEKKQCSNCFHFGPDNEIDDMDGICHNKDSDCFKTSMNHMETCDKQLSWEEYYKENSF